MQGYLKFKETDEELYEVNVPKPSNLLSHVAHFIILTYLNLVVFIKKCLNIITVKEIYSGLIFILPISNCESKKLGRCKKLQKCIPKLKKIMKKYQISNLILSEDLKNNEEFMQSFCQRCVIEKQVHILDGKGLMPYLIKEIIEYILKNQNKNTLLEDLYILVKENNSKYKENIAFLSQYFKTINIVTPCIKSYQKLANQLEEKYNTMITVTNNKKKSLRKAKWIVNIDMPSEETKKYTIYRTATIIYLEKDDVYKGYAFEGLHICKAGIDVSSQIRDFFAEQYLLNQCPITVLYESTLSNNSNICKIKKQMEKDMVKVNKLYGIRGELSEQEFEKVG